MSAFNKTPSIKQGAILRDLARPVDLDEAETLRLRADEDDYPQAGTTIRPTSRPG